MVRNLEALALARETHLGVLTSAQLNELGFTDSAIRANIDGGRWQALHPRVYLLNTGAVAWPVRARAALAYAGPGAVLSHASSAYVRGWSGEPPDVIDVTVPYSRRARHQPTVRVHRSRSYLHIVQSCAQPPRTTAARTVVDLLRACQSEDEALAFVLEAMRRKHADAASLWRELVAERRHR